MIEFKTQPTTFKINISGQLEAIIANQSKVDYKAAGQPSPLLQIKVGDHFFSPEQAVYEAKTNLIRLLYNSNKNSVVIQVTVKPSHIVLEIVEMTPEHEIEIAHWGPYATTIGDIIGEVVGVVRSTEFVIGVQGLNPKTLGGSPQNEDDEITNGLNQDDPGQYADLQPELQKDSQYRGDTAWPMEFGSILQLFCRNRNKERIIKNWGQEKYVSPALHDGGIIGSKVAIFGCPTSELMPTLETIEIEENLPHPTIEGEWAKTSPLANASYLIVDFGEKNIEQAIELTKLAGLKGLYHSSPFLTWGHFKLRPDLFPNGKDGFKECVEKAKREGITVGFHTLSNFTTPNDPYVTPKPDARLGKVGFSILTEDIDAALEEIPIDNPDFFKKATELNTVVIGDELIHYFSVSERPPWKLLECERGEWGTAAKPHKKGEEVAKLADHSYKVFLTNMELGEEEAHNIAAFCNYTGAKRMSMDGLEGNHSAGLGQYGRVLFAAAWYNALSAELRGKILNDASNPAHFNWHINSYYNWGEPWYAGFRESQTLCRFKNQVFYERNLLPRMLGWFSLRPDTSLEDAEWLLARAAGFDAGFTLALSHASTAQLTAATTSLEEILKHGETRAILKAIKEWETARISDAFPAEIKAALRDNSREFHLEPMGGGKWHLFEKGLNGTSDPIVIQSHKA
jgi:hypothetical protein